MKRVLRIDFPLDLRHTCGIHRRGSGDPTMRIDGRTMVRTSRLDGAEVTVAVEVGNGRIEAEAWGPGADDALTALPDLLGIDDDPEAFKPTDRTLTELHRRFSGLRIGRTGCVLEAVVPAVMEQKITGREAWRVFRSLVRKYGEAAPGPHGLWLLPTPETLTSLRYFDYHSIGLERRRAEVIRELARQALRLERSTPDAAVKLLRAVPGIGEWTTGEVQLRAFGDVDAVSVGDYHLPGLVGWALAGEANANDDRMLELLEPYRGQRGRVLRLLELGGPRPPRRGPRMPTRHLERL